MSIDTALQRVAAINQAIANPAALAARTGGAVAPEASPSTGAGTGTFAATLASANAGAGNGTSAVSYPPTSAPLTPVALLTPVSALNGQPAGGGSRIVAAAESQIGQTEQPPGSNESPAIAEYRAATAGAAPGEPWCAYFASWAARQAGTPLGPQGEGLGSVSAIWSWAQSAGRAIPNAPGVMPKPGDLIVFGGEHVGIVKGVLPDGSIQTIEGNYENKVSLNVRPAGEASGYVSMS
jgi:CHAP domain